MRIWVIWVDKTSTQYNGKICYAICHDKLFEAQKAQNNIQFITFLH